MSGSSKPRSTRTVVLIVAACIPCLLLLYLLWTQASGSSSVARQPTKLASFPGHAFHDVDSTTPGPTAAQKEPIATLMQQLSEGTMKLRSFCVERPGGTKLTFKTALLPGWEGHFVAPPENHVLALLDSIYVQQPPSSAPSFMLDIGMNAGYFTSHAVASGLHVIAFDPQPACIALQHHSLAANKLQDRARLMNAGVGQPSAVEGGTIPMHSIRCHGGYSWPNVWSSSAEENPDREIQGVGAVNVPVVPLAGFLASRRVRAIKMDVEANEIGVLLSASLEDIVTKVDYMITEVKRQAWDSKGTPMAQGDALMAKLAARAKRVVDVDHLIVLPPPFRPESLDVTGNIMFEFSDVPLDLEAAKRYKVAMC